MTSIPLATAPLLNEAQLAGQALVFNLLGKLIYEYPEPAWLQWLADENVFDDIPFAAEQPDVQAGLRLLQQWSAACRGGQAGACLDDLRADYTRLFIGPGKVLAPPWESVQVDEERLTFQEETLQVRQWYARFGLQVVNLHREPDDHAGLELAFLAHLAQLALAAQVEGNHARTTGVLEARQDFLREHPLRWMPAWASQVIEQARTDFYRGVALVARGVMAELSV
jgi:putative dimethyl sulfoxide reductase chaperone